MLTVLVVAAVALLGLTALWAWHQRPIKPVALSAGELSAVEQKVAGMAGAPGYQPGAREIILSERELNGLLHHNTSLGETLQLELASGAVHARIRADLDPALPLVGGRRLNARARFLVADDTPRPSLVLDDFTLWGVSLPNAWLGGIKGRDLLGDLLGHADGGGLAGVEALRIEPGRLVIRLAP
jgi:hypothetical protein